MGGMTHNEYFAKASHLGLVEEPVMRLVVRNNRTPDTGVMVAVMLDYHCRADAPTKTRNAYGAIYLFRDLSEAEFKQVSQRAVEEHGLGELSEITAAKALIGNRHDNVTIFQDDQVMGNPVIAGALGAVQAERYGADGHVGRASPEAINEFLKRGPCWQGMRDNLDEGIHPAWLALLQSRSHQHVDDMSP